MKPQPLLIESIPHPGHRPGLFSGHFRVPVSLGNYVLQVLFLFHTDDLPQSFGGQHPDGEVLILI